MTTRPNAVAPGGPREEAARYGSDDAGRGAPAADARPVGEEQLTALWLLGRLPEGALPASVTRAVLRPGRAGRGPGPDVREATLLLPSGVARGGDVEVHLRAGDWFRHGHHRDPAYDGVILHLVWLDDRPAAERGPVPLASGGSAPTVALAPVLRGDPRRLERLAARGPAPGTATPCARARARWGVACTTRMVRAEGRKRLAERAWRARRLVERHGWAGAWERLLERALASSAGRRRESAERRAEHRAALTERLGADPVAGLVAAAGEQEPAPRRLAGVLRTGERGSAGAIGEARALELAWNAALPLLIAAAAVYGDVTLARRTAALADAWPAPRPYGRTQALGAALGPPDRGAGMLHAQGLLHLQDLWCTRGGCGACPLS